MRKVFVPALVLGVFFSASARAQTIPTFTANLLGINEAPAAYDPKAAGFAYVTIDPTTGTVTYDLTAPSLTNTTAAHIHRGVEGAPGPVVIPFANMPLVNGHTTGATTGVSASLINEILGNPSGFYVNIHTSTYSGGAIRGRLTPAPGTAIATCTPDPQTLCLTSGRFKVQVSFQASSTASNEEAEAVPSAASAIPMSGDTGAFWFFTPNNTELVVKVLDARVVNGKFWVFFGSLTNVSYSIAVTDLTTGAVKNYQGIQGQQTSGSDTSAF